jgi:CheY-like chemotaxis protein/anti-sigma regulatory factor (Ser/Thr protein kinase)
LRIDPNLATWGHEIRTPLSGLIGTIGLLLESRLDEGQLRLAEMALESAERVLSALNGFLEAERIGAGGLELEEAEFELGGTVEAAAALLAGTAARKGLELVVDIPLALRGMRRGDSARLGQMLLNLLSNAVKFTERGHVVVSVREAAGLLRFEVTDTGPGIEPAAIGKLFQRFSQADASIARRFGGSGLGLAIVKELAGLMGGEVGVESQPGAGAHFWITIPLPRCAEAAAPPELSGRALVVEEGRQTRLVLVRRLLELGLEVEAAAADGLAAEEAARARKFDVVLLDRGVPGGLPMLDGVAIARRLRASGARLLLSAPPGTTLAPEERALFAGVLTRPLAHDALLGALRGVESRPGHDLLLAEDDPVAREVATRLLESAGHRVTAVADGQAAIAAARSQNHALVLMDLEMPGLDGLEALRLLRTAGCVTPVLALTAHAAPGLRENLLAAGMCGYLPKPFRPAELLEAVTKALAPLDPATIDALSRLPPGSIERILEDAEQETGRLMAPLAEAVAKRQAEPARQLAHALIGGLGACGAVQGRHWHGGWSMRRGRATLPPRPGCCPLWRRRAPWPCRSYARSCWRRDGCSRETLCPIAALGRILPTQRGRGVRP